MMISMDKQKNGTHPLRIIWVSLIKTSTLDVATWLQMTHELRQIGANVTLVTAGPPSMKRMNGIEVLSINWPDIYFFGVLLYHINSFRYIISRLNSCDIVMFHQMSGIWLMPLRLLGSKRPLLVMDTRDVMDFGNRSLKVRLRNGLQRLTYRLAPYLIDGQTAITERLAQLVGIPPSQLWGVWPSGVDPEAFAVSRLNRRWPDADEPIRLIYVGVFLEQRNLLPLAKAVKRANDSGMKFVISLYGDGALRPDLEAFASTSNGSVVVEQPIPHDQIPLKLAGAHIGVTSLPSPDNIKYEASSPLKLFEYMAAGLPVLSTTNRCHTDVVQEGNFAFWANDVTEEAIHSALQQAWDKRESLAQLGDEAFQAVQEWTWKASAQKLHNALIGGLQRSSRESGKSIFPPEA